jgi:hypothetical protein
VPQDNLITLVFLVNLCFSLCKVHHKKRGEKSEMWFKYSFGFEVTSYWMTGIHSNQGGGIAPYPKILKMQVSPTAGISHSLADLHNS